MKNALNAHKLNVSSIPNPSHTLTLGLFGSSGARDEVRYAPGEVSKSATSSPASRRQILEFDTSPWLNVRLGAQYVMYQKFKGAAHNYDVPAGGRRAKDKQTLHLYLWFAFRKYMHDTPAGVVKRGPYAADDRMDERRIPARPPAGRGGDRPPCSRVIHTRRL